MTINSLAPMLEVKDVAKTAVYFQDALGFEILFVAESDSLRTYGAVVSDDLEVHLIEHTTRDANDVRSGFFATVDNVDDLFRDFTKRNAFAPDFPRHLDAIREHPPEDKEYGFRDIIFVQPDGYILVFGEPLDS